MKALETALYAKLTGDATLMAYLAGGVHNMVAKPGVAYPYLVFQKVSGIDDYTLTLRIRTSYLYQVRIIAEGAPDTGYSSSTIEDALARVDTLLTNAALTVTGKTLWYLRREGDMPDMAAENNGRVLMQVGATYRIELGG
jgi:hypothetical protein